MEPSLVTRKKVIKRGNGNLEYIAIHLFRLQEAGRTPKPLPFTPTSTSSDPIQLLYPNADP